MLFAVLIGLTIVGKQCGPIEEFSLKCLSLGHNKSLSDKLSIQLVCFCSQVSGLKLSYFVQTDKVVCTD